MHVLGPKEAEAYLAYNYYLYYANRVHVLTPVVYGPPRIGKTDVIRRSFLTFVKAVAKRIYDRDFLGKRPVEMRELSKEELVKRLEPLVDVISTNERTLIEKMLEEVDSEEDVNFATIIALARKCEDDVVCSSVVRTIEKIENERSDAFYLYLINSESFAPTKNTAKAWKDGVLWYGEGLELEDYDDKFVYVEMNEEELTEEDLKGYVKEVDGEYFVKVPPRWARALAGSAAGLMHIENALVMEKSKLYRTLMLAVRKRVGAFSFKKMVVVSGPHPAYADVPEIPSYIASGNLAFVEVKPPRVREWREQLEEEGDEWAEEVYYFLELASPNYGEAAKINAFKELVKEISRAIRPKDAFIPPPEVARSYKGFGLYPTPKAWKGFAKALGQGRVEAVTLAYSYLGDETVADLFLEYFTYYMKLVEEGPNAVKEIAKRDELGARVAVAAYTIRALETGEGREELAKALEEVGLGDYAELLREGFTE